MKNTRNIVAALFLAAILAGTLACSSNDNKDEGASPDVAEAASDTGAPPEGGDQAPPADNAQASADNPPPADGAAPADPNAPPPADADAAALDAPPPADGKTPETSAGDMAAADNPPPADPNAPPPDAAAPPTDDASKMADAGAPPPPPTDDAAATPPADTTGAGGADAFGAAAAADAAPAPKKKGGGKLAHVKDAPFTKGGQNLNTVYIARDGDTMDSVSQKLFGEDKTKMLVKANPTLKKGVKTGDKIYFNSPNRPDDKERMMTVYEDQGLPPTPYTTKDGDSLKSLAQEWYGTEDSYKEIYAINKNLTSTKELPAGTELQYWPASAAVAAYSAKKEEAVAQAPQPPPPPPGQPPTPPGAPGAPGMPGGPNNMANNGMPGMPPTGAGAVGGPPGMPPGGNPPGMAAPPPPPTDLANMPPKPHKKPVDLSSGGGMDKDTVFYAGVAGILLVSSALWFALRRRRSRNGGVTQI